MISQALPGKTHPSSGRSDGPGKRREALQKLLARINTQHQDARPPVVAAAMWSTTGAPGQPLMRHRPVPLHHSIPVCRRRVWQHRLHVRGSS